MTRSTFVADWNTSRVSLPTSLTGRVSLFNEFNNNNKLDILRKTLWNMWFYKNLLSKFINFLISRNHFKKVKSYLLLNVKMFKSSYVRQLSNSVGNWMLLTAWRRFTLFGCQGIPHTAARWGSTIVGFGFPLVPTGPLFPHLPLRCCKLTALTCPEHIKVQSKWTCLHFFLFRFCNCDIESKTWFLLLHSIISFLKIFKIEI